MGDPQRDVEFGLVSSGESVSSVVAMITIGVFILGVPDTIWEPEGVGVDVEV